MSLFQFELRKLLFNKKNLILLLCLLILYSVVGLTSTMFLIGGNDSYRAYEELAASWKVLLTVKKPRKRKKSIRKSVHGTAQMPG